MSSKSGLKMMAEKVFEEALKSSGYFKKLVHNMSVIAGETKNVVEMILHVNDRLNYHEQIILKLIDAQKEKQDMLDFATKNNKEEPSKPN